VYPTNRRDFMSAGGGAVAAAAAAAHQAKMREEEEKMTNYTSDDLQGWEFKIVRSAGRIKGDKFRQLCEEESRQGWELVEKFDDYRVRFKRRVEHRNQFSSSEIDPYRTTFGLSDTKLVFMVLGAVFATMAAVMKLPVPI
jgi:hypothetical protein